MPTELQRVVVTEVELAKERSSMPVRQSLQHLGVARGSYFRWKSERAWEQPAAAEPLAPVQAYEALPEEKREVVRYALEHPEVRHRELAWRMVDEDVAYLSPSTVYRILRDEELMARQRVRSKRYREEHEKASAPDQIWASDLMHLNIGGVQYYLINFLDEYSRYLVHWELLTSMDGRSVSVAAQRAIETLPREAAGQLLRTPKIRSDNGSGYICGEFAGLLSHHGLTHQRIRPHCPEENGVVERFHRTLRERIEEHELEDHYQTLEMIERLVDHYNEQRLHSALGYQTPASYYRGNPAAVEQQRRLKLAQARHRRKQINLGIRQRTLPLTDPEPVASS